MGIQRLSFTRSVKKKHTIQGARITSTKIRLGALGGALLLLMAGVLPINQLVGATAQTTTPCTNDLVPQQVVQEHIVGESDCEITSQSTVTNNQNQTYNEVNIGLSGTAFGYVDPNTSGNTRMDITDQPNILYPQFGITSWVPAVGQYSGTITASDAGSGLTILYPAAKQDWNGKAFFVVHGEENDSPIGPIVPQTDGSGFTNETFNNLYADEMINDGYAVIYSRREASSGVTATLDNGTTMNESLNDNVGMLLDFLQTGEKYLQQQLGSAPSSVYYYGHSSGEIVGSLLNYSGMNISPSGKPYLNGFIMDDPGGGEPLPVRLPEGQVLGEQGDEATFNPSDELFQTASERDQFTKTITFNHDLYLSAHTWLPEVSYLDLKREQTSLLQQEGLGDKTRTYEIAGVSHIPNSTGSPANTVDMGGVIAAVIDDLNNWVQNNVAPTPTISDLATVSKTATISPSSVPSPNFTTDTIDKQTSIQLPPIACPTGVRYGSPGPNGSPTTTGYTAYDGTSLEPVNAGGALVDVNGNGYDSTMPTMQQAWQRLNLLAPGQQLTKTVYVACVTKDVNQLTQEKLLSQGAATWYIQQANSFPNLPW
jgi:hypothetical protein